MRRAIIAVLIAAAFAPATANGHFIGAANAGRALEDNNIGGWCGRGWDYACNDGTEWAGCFERVGYHSYICNVDYREFRWGNPDIHCFGTLYAMHYGEVTRWTWGPGGNSGCAR